MPLPETAVFGTFVGTLIILAYHFFRMEDDKEVSSNKDITDTYKTLREKLLDPILQDIISIRKAKMDPAKFMSTPEVIEKLSRYRALLNDYNNTNRKQLGLIIPLHLASITSLSTGIIVAVLISINEQVDELKIARRHIIKRTFYSKYVPTKSGLLEALNAIP